MRKEKERGKKQRRPWKKRNIKHIKEKQTVLLNLIRGLLGGVLVEAALNIEITSSLALGAAAIHITLRGKASAPFTPQRILNYLFVPDFWCLHDHFDIVRGKLLFHSLEALVLNA